MDSETQIMDSDSQPMDDSWPEAENMVSELDYYDEEPPSPTPSFPPSGTGDRRPQLTLVDQQRLSLYILTQRDRPISSLETMKKFVESPDNVESRVEELNEQYSEDLDKLYTALAEEYMDEEDDRYYSFDANELPDKDSQASNAYWTKRDKDSDAPTVWDYAVEHTMSTYRTRMEEIRRQVATREMDERMAILDFPQSTEEYRQKPKDIQHRAARFLVLESDEEREKMLVAFDWTWSQVAPLKDEFQAN
ncbi:hypothetical protein DFH08DRAFT_753312, partial [Mycena albidolilacea]